jgi:hypothetical protein
MKSEGTRRYPTSVTTTNICSTLPSSPYTANEEILREACSRAVATFLCPNATKELPVDAIVRDTVIRNLAHDCYPDVVSLASDMFFATLKFAQFLPVYEEAYDLLERHSLPRFLALASSNINRAHQTFTYENRLHSVQRLSLIVIIRICVGCILLALGFVAVILIITLIRVPPEVNRCWRLLAAFPFWLGSMACYSTSRGYISSAYVGNSCIYNRPQ